MLPPTTNISVERSSSTTMFSDNSHPDESSRRAIMEQQPFESDGLAGIGIAQEQPLFEPESGSSRAASKSASSGKAKIEFDPDFYIDSTFVVLQVENRLFRVPTYMFSTGSQFFNGMFRLPQPVVDGEYVEGVSPSNPIVVPAELNIKAAEFKDFLKALYPLTVSSKLKLSKDEWISVLKISRIWYFLELRGVAISELEIGREMSFIDKIVLGRENWISSWVAEGLVDIAQREETISDDDAASIDYITSVKLFRIRELKLKAQLKPTRVFSIVEEVHATFSEELAHISSKEMDFKTPEVEIIFADPISARAISRAPSPLAVPPSHIVPANPVEVGNIFGSTPLGSSFFGGHEVCYGEEPDFDNIPSPPTTNKAKKKIRR